PQPEELPADHPRRCARGPLDAPARPCTVLRAPSRSGAAEPVRHRHLRPGAVVDLSELPVPGTDLACAGAGLEPKHLPWRLVCDRDGAELDSRRDQLLLDPDAGAGV